ncbi:cupin domain-containing protein [Beggiatoa leptomitoformis]|uniref:DUF985 domain-containing protein n=1 Tax=Beggiatoa leptomitoformis TaxID=288004 RepID=A0A2N9YBD4_9GAMM|nr:cupin domain-containing protein [Beggiatoa leptomitoformis]ALG66915.1 hypothetical protein AL038_03285 [Beggiatoa leptomitoformis]AUI67719.1 hypothetical protein BLE401_02745 [Beggiatoa leptomitoformis]
MQDAHYWIRTLNLQAHPEGGYYRRTYCATESLAAQALPSRFGANRFISSAIYYLLCGEQFSALHQIKSDELWHFYAGSSINLYIIDIQGILQTIILGSNPTVGEVFQAVVPAGCWFGARLVQTNSYALLGCTVAPAFDFSDFTLARRDDLLTQYPQYTNIIQALTYPSS